MLCCRYHIFYIIGTHIIYSQLHIPPMQPLSTVWFWIIHILLRGVGLLSAVNQQGPSSIKLYNTQLYDVFADKTNFSTQKLFLQKSRNEPGIKALMHQEQNMSSTEEMDMSVLEWHTHATLCYAMLCNYRVRLRVAGQLRCALLIVLCLSDYSSQSLEMDKWRGSHVLLAGWRERNPCFMELLLGEINKMSPSINLTPKIASRKLQGLYEIDPKENHAKRLKHRLKISSSRTEFDKNTCTGEWWQGVMSKGWRVFERGRRNIEEGLCMGEMGGGWVGVPMIRGMGVRVLAMGDGGRVGRMMWEMVSVHYWW